MSAGINTMPLAIPTQRLHDFFNRINQKDNQSCWEWTGCKNVKGYGYLSINEKKYKAHRLSYYIQTNQDPVGFVVMHTCDNPSCCNPFHLKLGTDNDNCNDRDKKGNGNDGDRNPMSKLTTSDVIRMRQLFKDGKLRSEIAKEYNTTWANAHNICTGKAWKHI